MFRLPCVPPLLRMTVVRCLVAMFSVALAGRLRTRSAQLHKYRYLEPATK